MVSVPYVDLAGQHAAIKSELLEAADRVLDHGQFILGPEVGQFEQEFGRISGTTFAVGLNSGTDALILALRALEVGPSDEIITPPNSFVASASCIAMVGARPVFVDVRNDFNLDPELLDRALTARTKGIVVVHLTGRPADMDAIMAFARRNGLFVIEDAAQAVGACYRGKPVGSFGTFGCFSLHPLKTLNACGDAGVLTTSDPLLYDKVIALRNVGLRGRGDAIYWSGHSRLDTLQAAMLLVKLRYWEEWTEQRRRNAGFYQRALVGCVEVPVDRPEERAVYHTFVIQAERRNTLKIFLESRGVGTAIHYPVPIHLTSVGAGLGYARGSFPVTERLAERILSLPIYPELSQEQLDYVASSILEFCEAKG